jgi:predicted transposase YbfD/YdcC
VVTPSTTSSLPMIKKDNITKWIDNKLKLTELASLDQTGEMMNEVRRTINIEEVNQWMNDVY